MRSGSAARTQVNRYIGVSASDRQFPALTGRSVPSGLGPDAALIPSGERKPVVMGGHGLDGEAPLRRV
jgi:hypothetical protein